VSHGATRRRLRRIVEKHRGEVEGLVLRRYPAFVLGKREADDSEIPVFAIHEVSAAELTPMLEYLAANGYSTLTADAYLDRGGRRRRRPGGGPAREVLLTFDDGHVSLYRVAFPALRRLGQKAVAYVVPGRVPEGGAAGDDRALCHWGELAEMHTSGVIDVQSHSLLHHSIAISSRIVDFVRPGFPGTFMDSDLAPVAASGDRLTLGAPIHNWGARYSAHPAWREAEEVERACVAEVAAGGGAKYFERRDWRARLLRVAADARRDGAHGSFEREGEQRQAILDDLTASRHMIERRLPGKTVRHLCYPWYRGSAIAARHAHEAGYLTHAWGSMPPRFAGGVDTPLTIRRLPPELLWRLQGEGRRPLGRILANRWSRVVAGGKRRG